MAVQWPPALPTMDAADAADLDDNSTPAVPFAGAAEPLGLEIPEATSAMEPPHPPQSPSEITIDDDADEPDTDVEVDREDGGPILSDRGEDVKGPKETHDLRALATIGNDMSDRQKRQPNFCSVDVVGPDGIKKRFAPGTKAAFAVERFNCQLRDPALPVVCIVACKDGEDPIEFGPDVELVSYDESWTLKTLREGTGAVQYIDGKRVDEDPLHKLKGTIKEGTARALSSLKPVTKVPGAIFGPDSTSTKHNESNKPTRKSVEDVDPLKYFGIKNWEDIYPDVKLPEGDPLDCTPSYIGKVALILSFAFAFAGGLSYMIEKMPDPTQQFY